MRKENYEIKQGKNLSFKGKNSERFMRLSSLGEDYTEEMLRLKIEDIEEYKNVKRDKIDKVVGSESKSYNRWTAAENINRKIKTLNFLKENNINNIDELDNKISEIEKKNSAECREISDIKRQVSQRFDIINSGRIYWQYKPLAEQARKITDPRKREEYMAEHKTEMDKFKAAIEVMNKSKDENGKLPKSDMLYKEIEQLNAVKDELLAKNKKTKDVLTKYRNIRHNLTDMLGADEEVLENKNQQKQQKTGSEKYLR